MTNIDNKGNLLEKQRTNKYMSFTLKVGCAGWGETEDEAREDAYTNLCDNWHDLGTDSDQLEFDCIEEEEVIDDEEL